MRLLILTYPLTAVAPTACGGTEQMAYLLLRAWSQRPDLDVTWIGAEGSVTLPRITFLAWRDLLGQPLTSGPLTPASLAALYATLSTALDQFLARSSLDLMHNQGALFAIRPRTTAPILFTLHLPRSLYPSDLDREPPSNLHFQCVSRSQWRGYGSRACCGVIANGIDLSQYPVRTRPVARDAPLLFLGRICPEKAPHAAIAAARQARRRLWLTGEVAPFPSHRAYFDAAIAPHLGAGVTWLPHPTLRQKRDLLAACAAVLIPSVIAETSSIVAMEAAASGVPVLATRVGALPEVVADGETGWLGGSDDFPFFLERLATLHPVSCRRRAERLFSAERMCSEYATLYTTLAGRAAHTKMTG